MVEETINTYKKHNSFVELRHKHAEAEGLARRRIEAIRLRPELAEILSLAHKKILLQVFDDLFSSHVNDDRVRFALSPNVVEEINSLADEDLPRYLVHRYRYEIFPQQHVVDDFPPYLQIEPSSICNFRCVFCFETDPTFTGKSHGHMGQMKLDLFKHIIDQAVGNVEFISLASRGEPLLCKNIVPMLEYTRGKFLNLKLNTNASLLDETKCHAILAGGVKTVVFSVDAADEPLYSRLRVNGKLSVVLGNIERFQKIRQTQYPGLPVITRVSGVKFSRDQDIDSMQKLWGGLVDQVAFVRYNPWENVYSQLANGVREPCSDLWRRMFIWWDGKVNPCDVDYKSTLSVGNVTDVGLKDSWHSKLYRMLRQDHLEGRRPTRKPCDGCSVI